MRFMFWSPEESHAAYRDPFDLFADGAAVISEEIRELACLGCEYVQIDAPELAILVDPTARNAVFEANGISPERILGDGVDLLNSIADVPRDSFVVLGLVSTKKNRLESAEELCTRSAEAARYFPHDQMGLSTQCGFVSGIKGNPVDATMQEKKLLLVGDLAHHLWH